MNKKITLWLLALSLLLGFSAYTQQYDPENDFQIELIENGSAISITGYNGNRSVVNIPPRIQGLPVTSIGNRAFVYSSFTNITIPDSIMSIGREAFFGCTDLISIFIPASVTHIGERVFSVTNITAIHVAPDNPSYMSLDGVLYDREQRTLMKYPSGRYMPYTIPDSVTFIGNEAFSWSGLRDVIIPESVLSIGFYAFAYTGLTSVTIPDSVTTMGGGIFQGCISLTSITIPDSVTTIEWSSFDGCTGLISVTIPDNITSIGERAFYGCTSLMSITIPGSVTSIGEQAFAYADLTSITFGGSNTAIAETNEWGDTVFSGDLRAKYLAGGAGTYTREPHGELWTKL